MALNRDQLKQRIITELEALGALASGEHSWVERFAEAIANAVIDEIQTNAQDSLGGGIT